MVLTLEERMMLLGGYSSFGFQLYALLSWRSPTCNSDTWTLGETAPRSLLIRNWNTSWTWTKFYIAAVWAGNSSGPSGFTGHHPDVLCHKGGDLQEGTRKQLEISWRSPTASAPYEKLWFSKKVNSSFGLYTHLVLINTFSHTNKLFLCFFILFTRPLLDFK